MIHFSDRFYISKLSTGMVRFDFSVELNAKIEPSTVVYMTMDQALAIADVLVRVIGLPGQPPKDKQQ